MSHKINIIDIVRDIESGSISREDILKKYDLTSYKYYKIMKEAGIKNSFNDPRKKPKQTFFKKILNNDQKQLDESSFNTESFKEDCNSGMKISDLMEKYGLTLYHIRELRKKYDLKTK
jgi:Mor family transcriptional regulator